jgi:hypothetical protein
MGNVFSLYKTGFRAVVCLGLLPTIFVPARSNQFVPTPAPSYTRFWKLQMGSGAAYDVTGPGQRRTLLEITVLGEQTIRGADAHWIEVSSQSEGNTQWLIGKALLRVEPTHSRIVVSKLIMQWPGFSPMSFPERMNSLGAFAQDLVGVLCGYRNTYVPPSINSKVPALTVQTETAKHAEVPKAKDEGPETVVTAAGTFPCEHFRFAGKAGDVWVSRGAGPVGIVKANTSGTIMLLTRAFTGAKDRIAAHPQPYNADMLLRIPHRFGGTFWDWVLIPRRH